jgi:hypothetical protein
MPLTNATLNSLGTHLASLITHVSLHSADPGTTGTSETTAARRPVTWTVDADGDLTSTVLNFTGGAANGAVTHVGYWSALTGGTFRGGDPIPAGGGNDLTFNASGQYNLTPTINGTST